jgi:predicted enzyme related to lactoylglutathione lyase
MLALNRIIVFGKDIKGLKQFYQSHFKLTLVEEIEGEWVVLNAGVIEIAFHRIGVGYRNDQPFHAENNIKLVFNIEDNLYQVRQELLNKGVNIKDIQFSSYCDGEDIEGNVFQLHQKVQPKELNI